MTAPAAIPRAAERPLRLLANPVARFYRGSGLLASFRGDDSTGLEPEDWLGSCVTPHGSSPGIGLGTVLLNDSGAGVRVQDLVRVDPRGWLGEAHADAFGPEPAVLVKLLDAGQRLPLHVHPDRAFAREHLASRFGKTEAWLVLAVTTGEAPAHVWVGFRPGVTRAGLAHAVASQSASDILELCHELEVTAGDVVLVPAGTPHAIGAGVLVVEPQEPTDFSVLAEHLRFGVDADAATLGLGWERALACFEVTPRKRSEIEARHVRRAVFGQPGATSTVDCFAGFGGSALPFFRTEWVRVTGRRPLAATGLWTGIVTGGEGAVTGRGGRLELHRGSAFLVAAAAAPTELEAVAGAPLEVLRVAPPAPGDMGADW